MRSISKNHFCKYNILCKKMYTSFRNVAPESLNFLSICNWELFLLWSFIVDDDGKFITFDFRLTNLWNHSKKRKIFGEWYVLFNELLTSILFFSLIFWQEIFLLSGKIGIKVFLGLFLLLMWLKYWKLSAWRTHCIPKDHQLQSSQRCSAPLLVLIKWMDKLNLLI